MTGPLRVGAVIMPPVPGFIIFTRTLDDIINQTVNRVLDQFDIPPSARLLFAGGAHSVVLFSVHCVPVACFRAIL